MQIRETGGQYDSLVHQGHIRVAVRAKGEGIILKSTSLSDYGQAIPAFLP